MLEPEIIYEDAVLWVIRKPAGLATQTARPSERDVVSELKKRAKGGYVGIVHRLDQPVEGLLVFARTPECAAKLSGQFLDGTLNKEYLAVVYGEPDPAAGELRNILRKTERGTVEILEAVKSGDGDLGGAKRGRVRDSAKEAMLAYRTLAVSSETEEVGGVRKSFSLVRVHLQTGRLHQIRAQFAYAGHPLLGDRKYGSAESVELSESLEVKTVALCADHLCFRHPESGREMNYECESKEKIFSNLKYKSGGGL